MDSLPGNLSDHTARLPQNSLVLFDAPIQLLSLKRGTREGGRFGSEMFLLLLVWLQLLEQQLCTFFPA